MASIQDIAKAAGVSNMTVSRILNGNAQYQRPTFALRAKKIQRLALKMGYQANHAAQSTRSGRLGSVALLLSSQAGRSMLAEGLMGGILSALDERDIHLTITALPDAVLTETGFVPKILRLWMADGLLINYNAGIPPRMVELISESRAPKIWMNSKHGSDCVYPDELGSAGRLTQHLLAMGHRRIAFVNYISGTQRKPLHYSGVDRYEGYAQAMRQANLPPRLIAGPMAISRENQARIAFSRQWLSQADRPTAVICYNAEVADSVMFTAALMGLSLPRQLTVVTYADRLMTNLGMAVASMVMPEREMGRVGAEMLLERIDNPECVSPAKELEIVFEAGDTCARPESA